MNADIQNYGVKPAIIRIYRNLIIRENAGYNIVYSTDIIQ